MYKYEGGYGLLIAITTIFHLFSQRVTFMIYSLMFVVSIAHFTANKPFPISQAVFVVL